jgi:glutamine phosphoribosylpyrophosphate amidotransferase
MDEHTLYAARDRHGVRPLVLGKLETGWVVASESAEVDGSQSREGEEVPTKRKVILYCTWGGIR